MPCIKETGEEDNTDLLSGTLPTGRQSIGKSAEVENYTIMQYILTVEVIASYGDSSYTYGTDITEKESDILHHSPIMEQFGME